jgi:hypothetical protein
LTTYPKQKTPLVCPKKEPRGRLRQRLWDRIKKDLKKVNSLLDMEAALDRERWKGILEAAMVLNGPL